MVQSIFIFAIKIFSSLINYIALILITRNSSLLSVNNYTLMMSTLNILYIVSNFGYENILLFYLPKYRESKFLKILQKKMSTIATIVFIVSFFLYIFIPFSNEKRLFFGYLIYIITIFFQLILMINRCVQQVDKKYIQSVYNENLIRPLFYCILIVLFQKKLNFFSLSVFLLISYGVASFFAFHETKKTTSSWSKTLYEYPSSKIIHSKALEFFLIQFFNQLPSVLMMYLIGYIIGEKNAVIASFRIAFQSASLIGIGLRSIESVYSSKLSASFHNYGIKATSKVYCNMRLVSLIIGTVLCSLAMIMSFILPLIFGVNLPYLKRLFILLCLYQYFNTVLGSTDYLCMMTDNSTCVVHSSIVQTIIAFLCGILMIGKWGAVGAIYSMIVAIIYFRISLSLTIRNKIHLEINDRHYYLYLIISCIVIFAVIFLTY